MSVNSKLLRKLQNKRYRDAYVAEHIRTGIPFQIRALRDQRNWTQPHLAQQMGRSKSIVAKLEDPGYGKLTIQNLLEIASAFDVALIIKFVPFTRFLNEFADVSPQALSAASFADDSSPTDRAASVPQPMARMITGSSQPRVATIGMAAPPSGIDRMGRMACGG